MSDYDKALQAGLRQEFPGVLLHGRLFHYKQAVVKKSVELNLKEFFVGSYEGTHTLSLMLSLPLLPVNDIKMSTTKFETPLVPKPGKLVPLQEGPRIELN